MTDTGVVKIGDLGLARIYAAPLQSLYTSDKVVVTIWYRPPDLLLGARHYTASVDLWSTGCIFGELIALRPMFKVFYLHPCFDQAHSMIRVKRQRWKRLQLRQVA